MRSNTPTCAIERGASVAWSQTLTQLCLEELQNRSGGGPWRMLKRS